MYCRKCGNEIPDDSIFCLKCGTKVEHSQSDMTDGQEGVTHEKEVTEEALNTGNAINDSDDQMSDDCPHSDEKNYLAFVVIGLFVAVLAVIVIIMFGNANKCSLKSCDNTKQDGSDYCYDHTCREEGCTFAKIEDDLYCILHQQDHLCAAFDCENYKVSDGDYCEDHTCARSGCYNRRGNKSEYCSRHQVKMKKRLKMDSLRFSLNSAGGICFTFKAQNLTQKSIKYVRFAVELRNSVGDLVEDEIKGTTSVDVEIVGPVKPDQYVSMSNEIIGYCDTCARLDINDITIIYMDDTSETGRLGYYCEK